MGRSAANHAGLCDVAKAALAELFTTQGVALFDFTLDHGELPFLRRDDVIEGGSGGAS